MQLMMMFLYFCISVLLHYSISLFQCLFISLFLYLVSMFKFFYISVSMPNFFFISVFRTINFLDFSSFISRYFYISVSMFKYFYISALLFPHSYYKFPLIGRESRSGLIEHARGQN